MKTYDILVSRLNYLNVNQQFEFNQGKNCLYLFI